MKEALLAVLPIDIMWGVVNFAPKQVGPIMSECLVLGFYWKDESVVLAVLDGEAANGSRLL